MPFSLEQQLRLLGPQLFEELCGQLVKRQFPTCYHVEGAGGDKGLDIFDGELDPGMRAQKGTVLRVWQVKFFRDGVKRKQREQAEQSMKRALMHQPDFWTLCVPVDLREDALLWFQSLRSQYPTITLELWQADEIVRRARQDESLLDSYFLRPPSPILEDTLATILRRLDDFTCVENLLERAHHLLQSTPKDGADFYNGTVADWRDIVQCFDAPRERFGDVWQFVISRANRRAGRVSFALLTGRSGDGKSTVLMRLAAELVGQGHNLVFYHKNDSFSLRAEQLLDLPTDAVAFIFLDKVTRVEPDVLRGFLERLHRESVQAVVVAAAGRAIWDAFHLNLTNIADVCEFSLEEMTEADTEAMLDKLSADPTRADEYLGGLARLSPEEQMALFRHKANRQLLVALIEAKHGRAFEAYVLGELDDLGHRFPSAGVRRACIYVSAVYRFDLPMPLSLLQRLLPGVRLDDQILRRTHGLLTEAVPSVVGVITRHALIADVIFRQTTGNNIDEEAKWYTDIIASADASHGEDRLICHTLKGIQTSGNYQLASMLLRIGTTQHPASIPLLHMYAMDEWHQQRHPEARKLFRQASEIDSSNTRVWTAWAVLEGDHSNLGNPQNPEPYTARWLFAKAAEHDPKDVVNLVGWGDTERKAGNWAEAERLYLKAAELARDPMTRARIYFDLGFMFSVRHKDAIAAEYLEQAAEINPKDPIVHAKLGRIYGFLNRWDKAELHYRRALELNPGDQKTQRWYQKMQRARSKRESLRGQGSGSGFAI